MRRDRIVAWDPDTGAHTTLFEQDDCLPTSIAPYGPGYALLCHGPNQVVIIDADGTPAGSPLTRDTENRIFINPNDASADDRGGVYFSAAGDFRVGAKGQGALMYLSAEGRITRLAEGLDYANGVYFDALRQEVLVSEHLGGRVLRFPVTDAGRIGAPAVFIDLSDAGLVPIDRYPLPGPDGLERDAAGNLYLAVYGTGRLLIIAPDGTIGHRIAWSQPLITNVALTDQDRSLVLTGSQITYGGREPGLVETIANPMAPAD